MSIEQFLMFDFSTEIDVNFSTIQKSRKVEIVRTRSFSRMSSLTDHFALIMHQYGKILENLINIPNVGLGEDEKKMVSFFITSLITENTILTSSRRMASSRSRSSCMFTSSST